MATPLSITLHMKLKVYVTTVTPDGLFYVQLDSPDAYSLPSLSEQLSQLVVNNPGKNRGFSPSPGTKCCAQSLTDNCWYRGLVVSVNSSLYTVYFVDYGNTETSVPISRLFPAISKYFEMPYQAIQCKLANFIPNNEVWSEDIVRAMTENILNQELPALFYGELPDCNTTTTTVHDIPCYLATLYWEESDDTYTVSDELVAMAMGTYPKETPEEIMSVPKPKSSQGFTAPTATSTPNEYSYLTMDMGQEYKLYVSYAESPDIVWGQLSDHTLELDTLVVQLQEQVSFNGFTHILEDSNLSAPLSPGQPCCVSYSGDDNWCRGQIEEVDGETLTARVLYVDFGNTDTIAISDLYSLPSQFFNIPVQAISFSLYGIRPATNSYEWSTDAVNRFEQFYDNKKLIATVMGLDEDGYPSVRLLDPIDNTYIDQILIQEGFAVATANITANVQTASATPSAGSNVTTPITTPKVTTPSPSHSSTSSPKRIVKPQVSTYSDSPISIGKNVLVYVTVIESLDKFYCQLNDQSQELDKLSQLISRHCSDTADAISVALPNLPVLAKFSQDQNWYRGRLFPPKEGTTQWGVFFVDFGNTELVNLNSLVALPEPYLHLPAQCFECTLEGVSPSLLNDQDAIDEFSNLVLDQEIQCIVANITKRDKTVVYTVSLSVEGVDVAVILNSKSPSKTTIDTPKSYSDVTKSPSRSPVKSPSKASAAAMTIPSLSLPTDRPIQVVVCYVESPFKFSCQLSDNSNAIEYLVSQMCSYYYRPETPLTPVKPTVGTCCAGLFAQDNQWYRALITEIRNPNEISVLFVDYGNTEIISLKDTRELTSEFTSLPNQAVLCSLDGFSSSLINDEISFKFESHCLDNAYQCKFLSSDAGINTDPIPCQLRDISTGQSIIDSLIPKTTPTSTTSANFKLSTKESSPAPLPTTNKRDFGQNKMGFSQPSNERPSRPKDRNDKTGAPITHRSAKRSSSQSHRETSNESTWMGRDNNRVPRHDVNFKRTTSRDTSRGGARNSSSRDSSRSLTSADKIEPFAPFGNSPMIGWVSHIESPLRFFVQPSVMTEKRERLASNLYHYYGEEKRGEQIKVPLVNSFVCAYLDDEAFYRCKIQDVHSTSSEIIVFSIDYGSTHNVTANNVYLLSSKFYSLPGQAVCCKWSRYLTSDVSRDEMEVITEKMINTILEQEVELSFVSNRYDDSYEVDVNLIVRQNLFELLNKTEDTSVSEIDSKQVDLPPPTTTSIQLEEEEHSMTTPSFIFLKLGEDIECIISSITSAGHINIHQSTSEETLDEIMSSITNFITNNPLQEEVTLSSPSLKHGSVMLGQFTLDDNWYRVMILDLVENQVNVLYIDFGNQEILPLTRLHSISPTLLKYPRQVIKCCLEGFDQYQLSTGALEVLENELSEAVCVVRVKDCDHTNGVHIVSSMILKEDSRNLSEWAIETGLFVKPSIETSDHTHDQLIDHIPINQAPIDYTSINQAIISHTPDNQGQLLKNYPIKKGDTISVSFSHQEDEKTVWVTPTVQSVELEAMTELLNELYATVDPDLVISEPQTGTTCCVKSVADNRWYRAVVIGPVKYSRIPVLFVDYGNKEDVSTVCVLKSEFTSLPMSAIKCQLTTVVSESQWEEAVTLHFIGDELPTPTVWHVCVSRPSLAGVPPSPLPRPPSPIKDITIPSLQLKSGDKCEVYISHTESPNHFYCQLVQEAELLEELMAQIADYYTNKLIEVELEVGSYCVAQYSSNNSWYRATVVQILSQDQVEVQFIDYGNSEVVSTSSVQGIHNNFTHLSIQAFPCSLLSSTNGHFSEDQLEAFFSLNVDEESFQVLVKSQLSSGEWFVELYDKHGECPHELFLSPSISPTVTTVPVYPVPHYPPGTTVDVFVTCVNGPNDFYCQPLELASQLEELMTDIYSFMSSSSSTDPSSLTLSSVMLGQPCLARYTNNSEWYRGQIDTLHEDTQKVLVRYVDYGNLALLNLESIALLPSQFLSVPTQALHCTVLKSLGAVPSSSSEKFIRTLSEEEQYTLTILSLQNNSKYHVEVSNVNGSMSFSFLYDEATSSTTNGGDFKESETDESLLHSSSLVPKNSKSPPTDLEESEEDSNATGEPLIHAPCKLSLLVNEILQVTVVYVKDPSLLYLQRDDCHSELESLASEIAQYCTDCAGQLFQQSYQSGDFVLAQSHGVWYRAHVLDTLTEDGSFQVQFIDYGNLENVSSKNMIMCPANFLELPVQAIPCSLSQVPSREGWPDSYTQLILDLASDKTLQASVVVAGKGPSVPAIVNLQDLENEIDIGAKVLESLDEECEAGSAVDSKVGKDQICKEGEEERDSESLESFVKDSTAASTATSGGGSNDLNAKIEFLREKLELVCNVNDSNRGEAGETSLLIVDDSLLEESKDESALSMEEQSALLKEEGISDSLIVEVSMDYGKELEINDSVVSESQEGTTEDTNDSIEISSKEPAEKPIVEVPVNPSDDNTQELSEEPIVTPTGDLTSNEQVPTVTTGDNLTTETEGDSVLLNTSTGSTIEDSSSSTTALEEVEEGVDDTITEHDSVSSTDSTMAMPTLQIGSQYKVLVVNITSPYDFVCHLTSYSQVLDVVMTLLAQTYEKSESDYALTTPPAVGDIVCAKYTSDGKYYRAKILEVIDEGHTYSVLYLDYGNHETLTLDRLFKLHSKLSVNLYPSFGIHCTLQGLPQVYTGSEEFTDTLVSVMYEMVYEGEPVNMEVIRRISKSLYQVKLMNWNNTECINDRIIDLMTRHGQQLVNGDSVTSDQLTVSIKLDQLPPSSTSS